jgi:tetratricopeptide (TPR) repeat protein
VSAGEPGPDHRRAAIALAAGAPLAALNAIERLADPHALALRGIALAQLGEHTSARAMLIDAAARFAKLRRPCERARALAAAAESAAAARDLAVAERDFVDAARGLVECGDRRNAAWTIAMHARLCALRGATKKARELLGHAITLLPAEADPNVRTQLALAHAELAARTLDGAAAAAALAPALRSFDGASALAAEASHLLAKLRTSVAALRRGDASSPIDAIALTQILRGRGAAARALVGAPRWFVVDEIALRALWPKGGAVDLRRRPVMLRLLAALERRWPEAVPWRELGRDVFEIARPDESVHARCKVEIDRLRKLLPAPAKIVAERSAWRLVLPRGAVPVSLSLPRETSSATELCAALLDDGAAWSLAALTDVTAQSRSTVLRCMRTLVTDGRARTTGLARARRYVATAPAGLASQMLLVGLLDPGRG